MRMAYALVGYGRPEQFGSIDLRRRTQALRDELIARIAALFPGDVSVVRPGGRWRSRLKLRSELVVSVLVARTVKVWRNSFRWQIDPVWHEGGYVSLLACMDAENRSFSEFRVFPNIDHSRRYYIRQDDPWLNRRQRLDDLSQFCAAALAARPTGHHC
jgi:hypothetical protein